MITTTSFPARDTRTDLTENRLEKPLDRGERETLATCESVIHRGLDSFMEVGGALTVIRDQRLYRASHKTFEEYCREKWDMTGRRARQLCAAAGVVRNLLEEKNPDRREEAHKPHEDLFGNAETLKAETLKPEPLPKPTSERQVRALSSLPRKEQREAYKEAVQAAGGKAPTHDLVAAVVRKKSAETGIRTDRPDSRIEKILAEAERTVIQIRRLQDLIDATDTPMLKCCNAAVSCIEELEVKFRRKRNDALAKANGWQEIRPQKATKKTKISAAARARISAVAQQRWAAAKAGNSTQRRRGAGAQGRDSQSPRANSQDGTEGKNGGNGKPVFVVARAAIEAGRTAYLTASGGWSLNMEHAKMFKNSSLAEAVLGNRRGRVIVHPQATPA